MDEMSRNQRFLPGGRSTCLSGIIQYALAPIPLVALQPLLRKLLRQALDTRPCLFDRLGPHMDRQVIIDPINLPFALVLKPHPLEPFLHAYRRWDLPPCAARIRGSFLTLLGMIDGRLDGDALFFTRDLVIEGDTELIVSLRNAIDDQGEGFTDDVATALDPSVHKLLSFLRSISINDRH